MNLLIDLGNTRLKWAWFDGGELLPGGSLLHQGQLQRLPAEWDRGVSRAVVASVAADELVAALGNQLARRAVPLHQASVTDGLAGLQVGYEDPSRLGVDRWLALLGAQRLALLPACVADCGTAVTLDAATGQPRHLGGMILPGLSLMRASLAKGAHRLPAVTAGAAPLFATNTADAIRSGTLRGLASMLDGLAREYRLALGGHAHLLLTGGDAETLVPYLQQPWRLEPSLVLQGLAVVSASLG